MENILWKNMTTETKDLRIIQLVSEGLIAKEIGDTLNLSPRTVETYITRLRDNYGAKTQAELIAICFIKGILKTPSQKAKELIDTMISFSTTTSLMTRHA